MQSGRNTGSNTNQPPNSFPQRNKLLNKLFVKVKSLNLANRFEKKKFPLDKNFDSVSALKIIPDVREKQLVIGIN